METLFHQASCLQFSVLKITTPKKQKKILGENLSDFLKNLGISIANILFHNQIIPGIVFHKGSSVNFKYR